VACTANDAQVDLDGQLALFEPSERNAVDWIDRGERSKGDPGAHAAGATGPGEALSLAGGDHAVLRALEETLAGARDVGDHRSALAILASRLGDLRPPRSPAPADRVSLRQARDEWLRRLEAQQKSESTRVGYRVAIDALLDWSAAHERDVLAESGIVDYLRAYRERASPAHSTYYRRFVLLRRFLHWVSGRHGLPDPFHDLDAPPKPRQESDWLTPEEFRRLLDAAGQPERNLPGLAARDQLVLLTLVTTGLRRSELCALDWRDLELDGRKRSMLVRSGKGGRPRRQPMPAGLARELRKLRDARQPVATDPVFCGLAGGRLQETILADIIRRATKRAAIEKHVTAHTLRHTAATWLRQELRDTRLVAEYLGHADLSTVSRYAHVDREELVAAAGRLEQLAVRSEEEVARAADRTENLGSAVNEPACPDENAQDPSRDEGSGRRRSRGRRRRRRRRHHRRSPNA